MAKKINKSLPPKRYKRTVRILWIIFLVAIVSIPLYFTSVKSNFLGLFGEMPSYKALENPESENDLSSELYSADGLVLGKYYRFNRSQATYDELAPELIQTLLVTEDVRFFNHAGIDLKGLVRVFVKTVLLGNRGAGGGSTITQQLAKNIFNTRETQHEGSLHRLNFGPLSLIVNKTKEWVLAVELEKKFTKEEIMAMYLNTIFFGSNSYGIKVASSTFFNKTPEELDYLESALLVGMLNKPTRFNPVLNPDHALDKRNEVLYNLYKYDEISRDLYDSLRSQPIKLNYRVDDHNEGPAPYFRSAIRPFLLNWTAENGYDLFESGLKIYTTIDSRMQEYAEEAVAEHMKYLQELFNAHWDGENPWRDEDGREIRGFLEKSIKRTDSYRNLVRKYGTNSDSVEIELNRKRKMKVFTWEGEKDTVMSYMDSLKHYKNFLQTGFMAMNPKSGEIKAWVGGINHRYFKYDHVMQGRRQPGSTFKPFVYTAAIDAGYSPCYTVADAPVTFQQPGQIPPTYTPQNYNRKFTGEVMTIRQGMARSKNSITAFMMKKVGPQTVVDYAERMGVESPLDPVPALCLGVSDVTVYELVGAYSTFVNKGVYTKPHFITRIEDKYGNIIEEFPPRTREVLSEETAYLMVYMLRGATEEKGGTGQGISPEIRIDNEIGAKTGTTQNASDGWFVGLTKDLVAGAWVGGDDRSIHFRTSALGQGARTAMPIWDIFMQKVYANDSLDVSKGKFPRPTRRLSVEIDCDVYETGEEADSLEVTNDFEELSEDDIF